MKIGLPIATKILLILLLLLSVIVFSQATDMFSYAKIDTIRDYSIQNFDVAILKNTCIFSQSISSEIIAECQRVINDPDTLCVTFTTDSKCIIEYFKNNILSSATEGTSVCGLDVKWIASITTTNNDLYKYMWCKA